MIYYPHSNVTDKVDISFNRVYLIKESPITGSAVEIFTTKNLAEKDLTIGSCPHKNVLKEDIKIQDLFYALIGNHMVDQISYDSGLSGFELTETSKF